MKRSMLVLGIACVGCQPTAINDPVQVDAPRPREALGIDFAGWPSVTEKPWPVAPVMLLMCAPPTPEMVRQREAEKKERGPHSESAVVVRVNPTGREQFISGQPVPVGTVVVKEKYSRYTVIGSTRTNSGGRSRRRRRSGASWTPASTATKGRGTRTTCSVHTWEPPGNGGGSCRRSVVIGFNTSMRHHFSRWWEVCSRP